MVSEARPQDKGWALEKYAEFLKDIGLLELAINQYQEAAFTNSDDPLLSTYLAEIYFEVGDVTNALLWFDRAIEQNNSTNISYVFTSYCRILYLLGDYEKAIEMCERSVQVNPDGEDELMLLAFIYREQGNCDEAERIYIRILNLGDLVSEATKHAAQQELEKMQPCLDTP
jgi:tetratricopeptide (TPR) repeat protein